MNVLLSLFALLFSGLVAAAPLHNIVVFGDSLSDNGNLYEYLHHQVPPSPPYYQGRFSNGPVWIEHLAKMYFPTTSKAHLFDYAFGGGGVSEEPDDDALFTFKRELDTYLLIHDNKADANNLYVVWMGANNYLALSEEKEHTLEKVRLGLLHGLQRLINAGAKHILVMNLPDLGRTPTAKAYHAQALLTDYSQQHNDNLATIVADLQRTNPDIQWIYLDIQHMFNELFLAPANYGFTNTVDACHTMAVERTVSQQFVLRMAAKAKTQQKAENCTGYLFFDQVHPVKHAHELIAERAKKQLDALGIEFVNQ